jgi:hypothetical protein
MSVATNANAVDKCKVKIDNKTGVVRVDAQHITGPVTWGSALGDTPNSFFNDFDCVNGDLYIQKSFVCG